MNNDILAGILGGLTGNVSPVQTGKKHDSTETGDFMALLRDRLTFDADTITGSTQSNNNFSFRAQRTTGDLNPLMYMGAETKFVRNEKPTVEITSGKSQENDVRFEETDKRAGKSEESSIEAADRDPKAVDDRKATDAEKAAKSAVENGGEAVSEELEAENPELAKLLAAFSPEEKAALIEALKQLSPQDLQALSESPAEFEQQLIELVKELPESDLKDDLTSMLEKPEFMQLLEAVAAAGKAEASAEDAQTAIEQAMIGQEQAAGEKSAVTTEAVMNQAGHEQAMAAAVKQEAAVSETADVQAASDNEKTLVNGSEDSQASTAVAETEVASKEAAAGDDKGEAKADKAALKNTEDKNAEILKNAQVKPDSGEGESLRQEFKKLNEQASTAGTSGEEAADAEVSSNGNSTVQQPASHNMTPTEVKSAVEEVAKRFFSVLGDKNGSGNSEKAGSHVYSANPETLKKGSLTSNGAGNSSMGNGFSSQSGTTTGSTAAARPGAPAPAANAVFSELLEKAEFVKTKDGSKVLNLELDPKEMGKIEMELTSRDGSVTARISAESTVAKAKLDELAPQIKEQLISQGVNLTEITVDISSKNPDERNGNQMSGGKNKSSRITAAGKDDAEAIIRKNVLPNLRRAALNIQAVDMTV